MSQKSPFLGIDCASLVQPPETIAAFVEHFTQQARQEQEDISVPSHHEARSEPRYRVNVPVIIQQLNEQLEPLGNADRAVTRDISTKGIGLILYREVNTRFLALQMSPPGSTPLEEIQVLVEVIRCQPVGNNVYNLGGTFVTTPRSSAN